MTRTYPDTFDNDDKTLIDTITPQDVFIEELIVIVSWMNNQGEHQWKTYTCGGDRITNALGLLELAKADLTSRFNIVADEEPGDES